MSKLAMPFKMPEAAEALSGDLLLVQRALARDAGAFRTIIKTYNQRLYRIARGVVRNDSEAEDIVQEAYVRAFAALATFRGDASLATWLSRIVINEALGRLRKRRRTVAMPANQEAQIIQFPLNPSDDPERTMAQRQILRLVERATDNLPDVYRTVFIARVIDKGNPGTNDQFGLKLIAPNGQVMNEFTFNPVTLGGGNNQVPKK